MSLYDDLESAGGVKPTAEPVSGWATGIKMFQSQLQLKKAGVTAATAPFPQQAKVVKKSATVSSNLPPVVDLNKPRKEIMPSQISEQENIIPPPSNTKKAKRSELDHGDWNFVNEYDPMWPNEYEKVARDLKELREREREREDIEEFERRKRSREDRRRDARSSGRRHSDEEDDETSLVEEEKERRSSSGGVAIAPPPSLIEKTDTIVSPAIPSFAGSAVAAKIMAKYGFKEGQGLGKMEQGMSIALQVEKTSKRGGRIINSSGVGSNLTLMPPPTATSPPPGCDIEMPPPAPPKPEPTITEILKAPSKVVLLRNMVGPGEVDDELEPEVKDECNNKYGDVVRVVIHEVPGCDVPEDEAVRIFVEFKRIESAIKAVVDLSGRFFGGRQVKAGFYLIEKFNNMQLME